MTRDIDKSGTNKAGIDAVNFQLLFFILLGFSLHLIIVRPVKYLNNKIDTITSNHNFLLYFTPVHWQYTRTGVDVLQKPVKLRANVFR